MAVRAAPRHPASPSSIPLVLSLGLAMGPCMVPSFCNKNGQDPGLQVLVHHILPSPTSRRHGMLPQQPYHLPSVSPAVISINALAPAWAASWGFPAHPQQPWRPLEMSADPRPTRPLSHQASPPGYADSLLGPALALGLIFL